MYIIKFTPRGEKEFKKLPKSIQGRIGKKLIFYASSSNPLIFAKPLVNLPPSTHRSPCLLNLSKIGGFIC